MGREYCFSAEFGLDLSINEIARRVGVGVPTLFQRFPTRDGLVVATFADKMRAYSRPSTKLSPTPTLGTVTAPTWSGSAEAGR